MLRIYIGSAVDWKMLKKRNTEVSRVVVLMINSTKVNVFFTPNSPQTSSVQSLKCQKRKKTYFDI